jgi:hypothetical protein
MSDVVVLKQTYQRRATNMGKPNPSQFDNMDFKSKMEFWNKQNNGGLIGSGVLAS